MTIPITKRKPHWLKVRLPGDENYIKVRNLVKQSDLHTVCESAHCPNIGECWSRKTATFMIMGDVCTRNCRFCAVKSGKPAPLDQQEPKKIANAVRTLGLKYAVITSVTRDDLTDGGADHFAKTIHEIRNSNPDCQIEVLIPDFQGSEKALQIVFSARPDILNHNIETAPRLYTIARPKADYQQSLRVLKFAFEWGLTTKSGLMVGLGESLEEIIRTMEDLSAVKCKLLTIGQYLAPSQNHLPIARFVPLSEFDHLKEKGCEMGFDHIEASPLVRSSYHAEEQFHASKPG